MTLEFQPAFNRYLVSLGAKAPVKTFDEFMARGEFDPSLRRILESNHQVTDGLERAEYQQQLRRRAALRETVMTRDRRQHGSMRSSIRISGGSWSRSAKNRSSATAC